jgi:hypothetical protein
MESSPGQVGDELPDYTASHLINAVICRLSVVFSTQTPDPTYNATSGRSFWCFTNRFLFHLPGILGHTSGAQPAWRHTFRSCLSKKYGMAGNQGRATQGMLSSESLTTSHHHPSSSSFRFLSNIQGVGSLVYQFVPHTSSHLFEVLPSFLGPVDVTRPLKAGIVERIAATTDRQRRRKNVPTATNKLATMKDAVFSMNTTTWGQSKIFGLLT